MAAEHDDPEVQAKVEEFVEQILEVEPEQMVFIDETGLYLMMSLLYGWSPKGRRLRGKRRFRGAKHCTLIGALTLEGMLTEMLFEGWLDRAAFLSFVREFLVPCLRSDHVVILDNFAVHTDPQALSLIQATGARVLFLPPYSPDFDPIEHCWSKLKQLIRKRRPETFDELSHAVALAIGRITSEDIRGWFSACGHRN